MALTVRISGAVRGVHARYPWTRGFIERLRAAIFLADSLLSALIFLSWLGTAGLACKLLALARARKGTRGRGILFLSQEGFTVAPTRIRSYFFAERVSALGYPTRVLAFWDDIYRFDHLPDRPIFGVEQTLVSIRAVHRMLAERPAVIIEQRPTYDLLATWAMHWLHGTPVIFDIDDWIGDYTWFYPLRVRTVLPWFRSLASACIVSSARLEFELAPVFADTVKIPTYVDTDLFRPRVSAVSESVVVFGWNGTLFQEFMYESLLVMVHAFVRAYDRVGPSAKMVMEVAGTGDFYPKLEEFVAREYPGYPIRLKGWLDPRAMAEYLDGIDVGLYSLVLTERRRGTAEETFIVSKSPTKVFEYMAKGLPTLSTRLGEVANVIEQGVTGICSDDLAELCDGFVLLAQDAWLRLRMGQLARSRCVERFSMTSAARKLIDTVVTRTGAEFAEPASVLVRQASG